MFKDRILTCHPVHYVTWPLQTSNVITLGVCWRRG